MTTDPAACISEEESEAISGLQRREPVTSQHFLGCRRGRCTCFLVLRCTDEETEAQSED